MESLTNRTALVTGGASGIGLGIVRAFLRAGMNVVLLDVRRPSLDDAVESLGSPSRLAAIQLDVRDRDAWAAALAESVATFGNVHVLVSNAGVFSSAPIDDATFDDWDFASAVNIDGVVNGVLTVLPHLRAHGEGGHLLATSSTSGLAAVGGGSLYSATKYAVCGFMEGVATDLLGSGIGVSVIAPGPVDTHLAASSDDVRGRKRPETPADRRRHPGTLPQLSPWEVGERVVQGMRRGDLFIVTHREFEDAVAARHEAIVRAMPRDPIDSGFLDALRRHPTLFRNPVYDRQGEVPGSVTTPSRAHDAPAPDAESGAGRTR